jgi:putative transposase
MNTYKRHRFPPDIIAYAVWLYYRFNLSHRGFGDTFYIDEVFVKINDKQHYLWRAVDQDGEVVDVFLQAKRDGTAAKRLGRLNNSLPSMRLFRTYSIWGGIWSGLSTIGI